MLSAVVPRTVWSSVGDSACRAARWVTLISSGLVLLSARAAIAAVPFDFDGNGYADLATGVPGESVGSVELAGAVEVIYASGDGLTADGAQLWSRACPGVVGEPAKGE